MTSPGLRAASLLLGLALASAGAAAQQLTVSAAASLTNAFKEIGARFEAAQPGVTLRFNFAASGVLLQQIKQGARVDVLATADAETLNRGVADQLIDAGTRKHFAGNTVVVVVPAEGAPVLNTLADLSKPEFKRIAIGKPTVVAAGRYAQEALANAQLSERLASKLVPADHVRQVLDYVARGEVEAGFVFRSDAAIAGDKVRIALTVTGHAPVRYPAAVVRDSKHKALAQAFVDFLTTPAAQEVLARHRFVAATPPP